MLTSCVASDVVQCCANILIVRLFTVMKHTFALCHRLACCLTMVASAVLWSHSAAQTLSPLNQAQRLSVGGYDVCLYSQDVQDGQPRMVFKTTDLANLTWQWATSTDEALQNVRTQTNVASDTMVVDQPGLYAASYFIEANETLGTEAQTGSIQMLWLSPAVDSVSFVVDSATCDGLYLHAHAWAPDIVVGTEHIAQKLVYEWGVADSSLYSSVDTLVLIDALYDEVELTLSAINQAFNEALFTDTVVPVAVSAAFSHESRKEEIENEATMTGEMLSAPAEVAFTNESKGAYTVSEWAIGSLARLYDPSPVYQFQQPGTYTVKLTVTNELSGCASTDSSVTLTISEAALEFPNAFTPNGDGSNDLFLPAFRSLRTYDLRIYNRWGHEVFSSSDPAKGWDGTINGREAAAGTYYFYAKAEGYEKGVVFHRHGSVTLVRGRAYAQ